MKKNLEGVSFSILFAFLAIYIAEIPFFKNSLHLNPFIIAIFSGFIVANTIKIPERFNSGITFTSKKLLRFAIILLGFKITLNEIFVLGLNSLLVIAVAVISCFLFSVWFGQKIGLDKKHSILLASGTSICGASAIIATNEIIKSDDKDAAISVAIISVVGTFLMLLYPILFYALKLNENFYSVWVGSSIQEVGQVVGAGFAINETVGKLSSMIKMSRVTFIVPITFILLFLELKNNSNSESKKLSDIKVKDLNIPWFVLAFIGVIFFNSLKLLPENITKNIVFFDNLLLTAAMFCLGMGITISKIKAAGIKPIYLGFASAIQISITTFLVGYFLF
ncbi:MAG: YeiH family protein [Candidatus Sericytochromatia bacterium]